MFNSTLSKISGLMMGSFISFNSFASDALSPGDSQSKWIVSGYAVSLNNIYEGEEDMTLVLPNVEYRGERFFIKDGEFGARLYSPGDFSMGVMLTGRASFLNDNKEYKDNTQLAGLQEREVSAEAGMYFIHNSNLGQLKVKLLDEVSDKHNGQRADVNYVFDLSHKGWRINPSIGATWESKDMNNYYYGVSASEANAQRAQYTAKASTSVKTAINARYAMNDNWDLHMGAGYTLLGDGISDSSIVQDNEVVHAVLGATYNF